MTLCVILVRHKKPQFVRGETPGTMDFSYEVSMVAESTSMIGMSSWMG